MDFVYRDVDWGPTVQSPSRPRAACEIQINLGVDQNIPERTFQDLRERTCNMLRTILGVGLPPQADEHLRHLATVLTYADLTHDTLSFVDTVQLLPKDSFVRGSLVTLNCPFPYSQPGT